MRNSPTEEKNKPTIVTSMEHFEGTNVVVANAVVANIHGPNLAH